jgi:hypothetical protein
MMGMPTSFPTVSRSFSGNVQPNGDKDNISAEFQAFTERLNRRVQTSLQHNAFKPKPLQHYPGTAGISAQIVTRESACASSLHIRSRKSVKRTKQDLSASMERLASPGLQIRPVTSDGGSDQGASLQLFSPIRSQKEGGEGGFGFARLFDPSTYDVTEAEETSDPPCAHTSAGVGLCARTPGKGNGCVVQLQQLPTRWVSSKERNYKCIRMIHNQEGVSCSWGFYPTSVDTGRIEFPNHTCPQCFGVTTRRFVAVCCCCLLERAILSANVPSALL